jgi:serine phosphatase RsbU (regulator of sigma subunit)
MRAVLAKAREDRLPYRVEHRMIRPDGTLRWVQGSGQVIVDDATGEVTGAIGCSLDVTALMEARLELAASVATAEAATERERAHRQRLEFLGRINDALAAATTREQILERVTRTAVPRMGDWCLIYAATEDGGPPDRVSAHADPSREALAAAVARDLTWDPDSPVGMPAVFRTGMPEFHPVLDPDVVERIDEVPEALKTVVRELSFRSVISVPMLKRGRVVGGLQFVMAESGREYTEDDLALAESIAARVASALENLRLADHQRHIAVTLQASLLPSRLPAIDGLDVAVRYWAAGEGTEVGGDFYDLFDVGDGTWAAVIGDVCGTGPVAASMTSLARNTIRACAWRGDHAVTVLDWLNRAMLATRPGWFLTACYLGLRPAGDGFDVEVTAAGHPHPVVLRADGGTEVLGAPGTLLGVFDEVRFETVVAHLGPGDTVVLYTDGICDVAPPHGLSDEQVLTLFRAAAAEADDGEALADAIHERLAAVLPVDDRNDDIALLLLRLPGG